jgi:diguanylate cyclase (GGDEF)-like protein
MDFKLDAQKQATGAPQRRQTGMVWESRTLKGDAAPRHGARKEDALFYTAVQLEMEELRRQLQERDHTISQLQSAILTDPLTDLYNRRGFQSHMHKALADVRRHGCDVCLLYVDLDHFKAVNDTHGHLAGDHLLGTIARTLQSHVREADVICRLSGDEFAILLRHCDHASATATALRLEDLVATAGAEALPDGPAIGASIGVVPLSAELSEIELLEEADRRMYARKAERRAAR